MKVCEMCGTDIDGTRDGENRCSDCEDRQRTSKKRKRQRMEHDAIMRSLGLVKVKGDLGGTYWE